MARYVINDLLYDTKRMQRISHVKKFFMESGRDYDCVLYRSKNGRFLIEYDVNRERHAQAISEDMARNLLMHQDYDNYVKLYGELEEA